MRESGKGWKTLEKVGKFWKVWKSVERDRGAWPPKTMAFGFSVVEFVLDGVSSRLDLVAVFLVFEVDAGFGAGDLLGYVPHYWVMLFDEKRVPIC